MAKKKAGRSETPQARAASKRDGVAATRGSENNNNNSNNNSNNDDDDGPPLPFVSRVVIIVVTSFLAEKIWRYRSVVSAGWYSERQSPWEQAMVTGFEYTLAMGALFFVGILVSVATVWVQKRVFGV